MTDTDTGTGTVPARWGLDTGKLVFAIDLVCRKLGISVNELARQSWVPAPVISNMRHGTPPSADNLVALLMWLEQGQGRYPATSLVGQLARHRPPPRCREPGDRDGAEAEDDAVRAGAA